MTAKIPVYFSTRHVVGPARGTCRGAGGRAAECVCGVGRERAGGAGAAGRTTEHGAPQRCGLRLRPGCALRPPPPPPAPRSRPPVAMRDSGLMRYGGPSVLARSTGEAARPRLAPTERLARARTEAGVRASRSAPRWPPRWPGSSRVCAAPAARAWAMAMAARAPRAVPSGRTSTPAVRSSAYAPYRGMRAREAPGPAERCCGPAHALVILPLRHYCGIQ